MASKVRLFVDHPLGEGQLVPLSRDQANYLFAVMRLPVGTVLSLINSRDGEWDAEVIEGNKRNGVLRCIAQTRPLQPPPDLWLLFAPIKKARTDFIVERRQNLAPQRSCRFRLNERKEIASGRTGFMPTRSRRQSNVAVPSCPRFRTFAG